MGSDFRNILKWIGKAFVAASIFAGIFYMAWQFEPWNLGRDQSASVDRPIASAQTSGSSWTLEETDDPMTDVHSFAANRWYEGAQFKVRVAIKCLDYKQLVYELQTFKPDNMGVSMASSPDTFALTMMKAGLVAPNDMIRFMARIDQQKADNGYVFGPKYSNVLNITPRTIGVKSTDLAEGMIVLIRLPTRGGEETVEIEQGDPNVLQVFEQCSATSDSKADASSANEAAQGNLSLPGDPTAWDDAVPTARFANVGQCAETSLKGIGTRLEGVADSGSAVRYANGIYGVSYEEEDAIKESQPGDPIKLCLTEKPEGCPPGDNRGGVYKAINLRTARSWELPDSSHECGGA